MKRVDEYELSRKGGKWLGKMREGIKVYARNGESVTWGSRDMVSIAVQDLEYLASCIAASAINEHMQRREIQQENQMDVLDSLLSHLPGDMNLVEYLDGNGPITVDMMREKSENGDFVARQYFDDLMKIAIDLLKRKEMK